MYPAGSVQVFSVHIWTLKLPQPLSSPYMDIINSQNIYKILLEYALFTCYLESMEKELKQNWIKALRSGKYKQGIGALCRVDANGETSYCCMGVLMEVIYGEDVWTTETAHLQDGSYKKGLHDKNYAWPPKDIVKSLGVLNGRGLTPLASMNDGGGKFHGNQQSFEQIADWIEENK